jgi:exopolysaccharide biosynthesis polyprenyl glycosylphosphotransferase
MLGNSLETESALPESPEKSLSAALPQLSVDSDVRGFRKGKSLLLLDLVAVLLTAIASVETIRLFNVAADAPHRVGLAVVLLGISLPLMAARGLYSRLYPSFTMLFKQAALVGLALLTVRVVFVPLLRLDRVTALSLGAAAILFCPVFLGVRQAFVSATSIYRSRPYSVKYVAVIGCDEVARTLIDRLHDPENGCFQVVGCFAPREGANPDSAGEIPLLGTAADLRYQITQKPVDAVVFATAADAVPASAELIDAMLNVGIAVAVLPQSANVVEHDEHQVYRSESFAGMEMTLFETVSQPLAYRFAKRALDIVLSSLALLAIAPLLLIVALLVKITSPDGPVFYPWRVLGKNRRPFVGYKFRTMVANADQLKKQLTRQNEMNGPVFKMRNDPRITGVGRWLRKFSIDELPQLYSVLKGDMSLVGPRPAAKSESDRYQFWQHRKLCVKPGITCLWQVSGRSEISDFEDWVRLDLEYIRSASLALDVKILFKTIPVVLFGRGAY